MLDRDRRSYSRYHDRNEVEDDVLASKAVRVREIIACVRDGRPMKRWLPEAGSG